MSNGNKRRKRDCKVLNRQELYEKYIPHISRDFAKIVDKSKNNEFKQRCQQLLKVNDPSKIEEAIAGQLFKLTLGNQYNVTVSQNNQEKRVDESINQEEIQSCFSDLADHIDDDGQWPTFSEHSSLPAENVTEVNLISSLCASTMAESRIQDTDIRLPSEKGTDIVTSVGSNDDENFDSLELHAMFDEASWEDTTTGFLEDQRVPRGNIGSTIQTIPQNYQQALRQLDTSRKRGALPRRDAVPCSGMKSTIVTVPQNYQPVLQLSGTSRERSALPHSDAVPCGGIKSTIVTAPQNYQSAMRQLDTSKERSALPCSDAVPCGGIKSTIVTVPQNYQPVLQRSSTSRAESGFPHSDAVRCSGIKSTIVTVPQHYQQVLQRSGTSRAESAESDDSHFETLANIF